MKTVDTITFIDVDSNQEGVAIVRYNANSVNICLSLKLDGDIEVFMNKKDAERLVKAIKLTLE